MADLEKVTKGLESLHTRLLDLAMQDSVFMLDASMVANAIDLLKEQEAIPVVQRKVINMLFWCCGSCGVAITEGDKFCRMCGKMVKWK